MKPEFVIASNFPITTNSIDLDSCQLSTEFVKLVSIKKYVVPVVNSQSTSSSQFDIKVSSNEVTVNVQINNNNTKTNNDQMINTTTLEKVDCESTLDNMVPPIAQFDHANIKPIDISNCDESLNHSKKTNTWLFIPPRILRSNMKRLRSTRNY